MGQADVTRTTIARTGQPADMVEPGFLLGGLCGAGAIIADNGDVCFGTTVTGPGVTTSNGSVLLAGQPGSLVEVAREADPIPGHPTGAIYLPGLNTTPFGRANINEQGQVTFRCDYSGGSGVMAGSYASPTFISGNGFPAPGYGSPDFETVVLETPFSFNEAGLVAWVTAVRNNVNSSLTRGKVIYTGDVGSQIPWVETSGPSPFTGASWTLQDQVYFNDQGSIAFMGILGTAVPTLNRRVIYAGPANAPTTVAQSGLAAPDLGATTYGGFPNGVTFRALDPERIRIANNDVIAFATPTTGATDGAIFLGLFGDVRLFAADGQQAPDLPTGVLLDALGQTRIELNGNAEVAFIARLTGPGVGSTNDSAIFEGPSNDIRLLVREGDPVPGGGTVSDLFTSVAYLGYNDRRQVVFQGGVSTGQGAYFGTTPGGLLAVFARQSSLFVTDDGFSGGLGAGVWTRGPANNNTLGSPETGRSIALNNAGQFVVDLCFSGATGSGVFMFTAEDPCVADLSGDGTLNNSDINLFVSAFIAMDSAADLNGDGVFNNTDINQFVQAFLAGC